MSRLGAFKVTFTGLTPHTTTHAMRPNRSMTNITQQEVET